MNTIHFLVFLLVLKVCKAGLPSFFQVCKRTDPKLNECVRNSAMALRSNLKNGIPELKVPKVEPFELGLLKLRSGPKQAKINADIKNVKVYGISSFELTEVKIDVDKIDFLISANLPSLSFTGDYDLDISLLILTYKGQGKMSGNFSHSTYKAHFNGHLAKIDGKDCAQFEKLGIELKLGKSSMQLETEFLKDKTLGIGINAVLEDNSDVFFNEAGPLIEAELAKKITDITNKITGSVSYDELFPK